MLYQEICCLFLKVISIISDSESGAVSFMYPTYILLLFTPTETRFNDLVSSLIWIFRTRVLTSLFFADTDEPDAGTNCGTESGKEPEQSSAPETSQSGSSSWTSDQPFGLKNSVALSDFKSMDFGNFFETF